jgi:very-short-patch-repair endonuclease
MGDVRATIARARKLRSNLTDAESYLWRHLRFRQIAGHKFRRQRPIGPYIVDFVCLEKKVVIEVDGGQHAQTQTLDDTRDKWLRSQGYVVLRFWNNEVLREVEAIKEAILRALTEPPP